MFRRCLSDLYWCIRAWALGITYNGMQERRNKSSLPMFTDTRPEIGTKTSFIIHEGETIRQALNRSARTYIGDRHEHPSKRSGTV